ncbi:MAG: di-heme oxidoredictase family protein, partial [Polyangiales bacterium]
TDGSPYELLRPAHVLSDLALGPAHPQTQLSPRTAPAVIGLGLLEAIELARLEALADPQDADGDGISGRIHWVEDKVNAVQAPGRFGWKAEQPNVRQQSAAAFLGDVGITTSIFAQNNCTASQAACFAATTGGEPELPDRLLDRVELYGQVLAPPARARWDEPTVIEGRQLFRDIGCADCHIPDHRTGPHPIAALADQHIWPYTDLLLHDMGPELSDGRPVGDAGAQEWRTPPLWGLGFLQEVNGHERLLHDGRARGPAEAILWHGGEAKAARERFVRLNTEEREALIAFLRSL